MNSQLGNIIAALKHDLDSPTPHCNCLMSIASLLNIVYLGLHGRSYGISLGEVILSNACQ